MQQYLTIYKASAGSGKTFTLAVEYILQLLAEHAEHEFEHTLAVTFTNKATAEMKERIVETLYGLAHRLPEAKGYMSAIRKRLEEVGTPLTEEVVGQRADKALTAILHDYSHFRVETIDAFFQSILRGMARELGLAANYQVELSHDDIIDIAVDKLLATMDEQPEVRRWVMEYVGELLDNGERWDITQTLKNFAKNIFSEEYQQRDDAELERISDSETVKAFKDKLVRIIRHSEEQIKAAKDRVRQFLETSPLTTDMISYGDTLCRFLQDDGAEPKKTIRGQADGSKSLLNAAHKKDAALQEEAERLRERLADAVSTYDTSMRSLNSATLSLRNLNVLRLLRNIDEHAREISNDSGRFILSSTPVLLGRMVESSDAPFIFEKMGTLLSSIMIDEFQDTSHMQWKNFKKLLFEKIASGGKGLLVGDIKQSIYRWRSGDWKILYNVEKEKELQRFEIKPKPLCTNYRSLEQVVEFNNRFFPPAAALLDAIDPDEYFRLSTIYEDVKQDVHRKGSKGHVSITISRGEDAKDPAYTDSMVRDMVQTVRQLQADGLGLEQMAILVRENKDALHIIQSFASLAPDISLVSSEAFLLDASTAVRMMVAALRLLIDRKHADLVSERYLMLHYLTDILGKQDVTLLDVAGKKAEEVLPEAFASQHEALLQLPLYILCQRLFLIFQLDRIRGEEVYVLTFLDEVQNHLHSGKAPDVKTFLDVWDETLCRRSIPASEVSGIRILTIHKSKGLEFHTVLLPFTDWTIEADKQNDILWCTADEAPYDELGSLPISIYGRQRVLDSVYERPYRMEHLERRVDALNMLYVAFTRAKANLYVWGKAGKAQSLTSSSTTGDLIYQTLRGDEPETDADGQSFHYEVGTPVTNVDAEETASRNPLVISHSERDAIDVVMKGSDPILSFRQSNMAQDFLQGLALLGEEQEGMAQGEGKAPQASEAETLPIRLSQREVGKRMHEVLSLITDAAHLEEALREGRETGLIEEGEDWDAIIGRIRQGFASPLVASWFAAGSTVYSECSIACHDEKTGGARILRPDRVVMHDGRITVIDYKFGRPSSHYYDQVADYMAQMQRMYPDHEVCGYIWYVMGRGPVPVHP